jgi:hypothetical protein
MPNESKAPEEYVSDALDLMVKARWVKQYGQSAKGLRVDWTDRGKLAMDALGYVIEDLGPECLNQQLWWAVGTLAAVHMMPWFAFTMKLATSTYLVGKNESGNQKGNLSYLAGTKKRSDSLMQSRKGARAVGSQWRSRFSF